PSPAERAPSPAELAPSPATVAAEAGEAIERPPGTGSAAAPRAGLPGSHDSAGGSSQATSAASANVPIRPNPAARPSSTPAYRPSASSTVPAARRPKRSLPWRRPSGQPASTAGTVIAASRGG